MYEERSKCLALHEIESGLNAAVLGGVQLTMRMMQRELTQLREVATRQKSEFANYRRRTEKEIRQIRDMATEELVVRLLPVMDNFERALESVIRTEASAAVREGLEMVATQLTKALEEEGVTMIEALGCPFDPNVHEAVSTCDDAEVPEHHIVRVIAPGYKFGERVLKPAMVVVSSRPTPAPAKSNEE
jgi:molecular chaperone GrpE